MKKELSEIKTFPELNTREILADSDDILNQYGIVGGVEIPLNDRLTSILHKLMEELVNRGLILISVEDSSYNPNSCQLTLSVMVAQAPNTQRRLDISTKL